MQTRKAFQRALRMLWLVGLAATSLGVSSAQDKQPQPAWQVIERRPADQEQCLVCGTPIESGEVIEIRYKGRTFHVMPQMLERFSQDPDANFTKLQARSALFDENSVGQPLAGLWLWIGIYMLAGLIGAAVCGYLAVSKSLPPLPWFFAGLAGNLAAVVVVMLTPAGDASSEPAGIPSGVAKVPLTRSPVSCPSCGAENHPAAARCNGCGSSLQPSVQAETSRV